MPELFHAVITRFSIRNLFGPRFGDALEPERLERSFALLEATCLPSLAQQSTQDFTWLILTDANASDAHLRRLQRIARRRPPAAVLAYQQWSHYRCLDWLQPYVHAPPDRVLTTILDDDDALRSDYFHYLHDRVASVQTPESVPLEFIGCEDVVQWDLTPTEDARLGFEKPWLRRDFLLQPYPASAGFTLSVHADLSLCVFGFSHSAVPNACRPEEPRVLQREGLADRIAYIRTRVRDAAQRSGLGWDGTLRLSEHYHACTLPGPQAVVCNHADNARAERAATAAMLASPVRTGSSFPGVAVDFERAAELLGQPGQSGAGR